jgi:hemoglobin-like flavoprotein
MTPEEIKLIKLSFVPLMGRKLEAGKIFYARLFEVAPDTRPMFKSDIGAQAEKLMSMLGMIISSLQDTSSLVGMLESLGRRHAGYGVMEEHYANVRAALLRMLEEMLGDAFTDAARKAWCDLFDMVAGIMQAARETGPGRGALRNAAANK